MSFPGCEGSRLIVRQCSPQSLSGNIWKGIRRLHFHSTSYVQNFGRLAAEDVVTSHGVCASEDMRRNFWLDVAKAESLSVSIWDGTMVQKCARTCSLQVAHKMSTIVRTQAVAKLDQWSNWELFLRTARRMSRQKTLSEILGNWLAVAFILIFLVEAPSSGALSLPLFDSSGGQWSFFDQIRGYNSAGSERQQAPDEFSMRVSEALDLLEQGKQAQARGDFSQAVKCFDEIKQKSGDLALAEYARVGHALSLYEVGDRGEAILEMEDVSITLKGYPEIHAALAAALYVDKHAVSPAERQFSIATMFDPRYTDPRWVQATKHWPPSLIHSLERFISLK